VDIGFVIDEQDVERVDRKGGLHHFPCSSQLIPQVGMRKGRDTQNAVVRRPGLGRPDLPRGPRRYVW